LRNWEKNVVGILITPKLRRCEAQSIVELNERSILWSFRLIVGDPGFTALLVSAIGAIFDS
jgi:hypothetical protein